MLSYADIVDWFVEFLFGCMSELLTLNNRKETKRLPLQLPYPQALGSEYKLVSDGPVALTILRSLLHYVSDYLVGISRLTSTKIPAIQPMNITALSDWLQPWCRKLTFASLIAYERIDRLTPHVPKGSRDNS